MDYLIYWHWLFEVTVFYVEYAWFIIENLIIDYLNWLNYLILELVIITIFRYWCWPPLYVLHLSDNSLPHRAELWPIWRIYFFLIIFYCCKKKETQHRVICVGPNTGNVGNAATPLLIQVIQESNVSEQCMTWILYSLWLDCYYVCSP